MANIAVANSLKEIPSFFLDLFDELEKRGHFFYFLSTCLNSGPKDCGKARKAYFGPEARSNLSFAFFLLAYPFLFFFFSFSFVFLKYNKNVKTFVCLGGNEKIILTPLASLLRIKVVWLELPEIDYRKMPAGFLFLYRFYSRRAILVSSISLTEARLGSFGITADRIKKISPGIKPNQPGRQQNIFSNLAKAEKSNFSRKYFTLGVITDFSQPHQIENLFQAVKICLAVIPNLQLIIVGECRVGPKDEGEKKLSWLAKKLGIDNLVWFVSERGNLKKWSDSFDAFIAVNETPRLANLATVLRIMSEGLPVIGFCNRGFEDLILEEKAGILVETGNSEVLAQKIIELYKNKIRSRRFGEKAKSLVEADFTLEKAVAAMGKILI
ncbi:MAG: glycosyltransferase [Patescibacteria group bacterium]|nr:glycosyltransferase [Patescibacteria group bacterium]